MDHPAPGQDQPLAGLQRPRPQQADEARGPRARPPGAARQGLRAPRGPDFPAGAPVRVSPHALRGARQRRIRRCRSP
jgi:hypothetical protein